MKKILMKLKYVIPILSLILLLFWPLVVCASDIGFPDGCEEYAYYLVVYDGSNYVCYLDNDPFYLYQDDTGAIRLCCLNNKYYCAVYDSDLGEWGDIVSHRFVYSYTYLYVYNADGEIVSYVRRIFDVDSVLTSNFDVIGLVDVVSGEPGSGILGAVFFKAPQVPIVKKAELLIQPIQTQAQIITTVVVGCLALLVGLTILAKKLRIFLPL